MDEHNFLRCHPRPVRRMNAPNAERGPGITCARAKPVRFMDPRRLSIALRRRGGDKVYKGRASHG